MLETYIAQPRNKVFLAVLDDISWKDFFLSQSSWPKGFCKLLGFH